MEDLKMNIYFQQLYQYKKKKKLEGIYSPAWAWVLHFVVSGFWIHFAVEAGLELSGFRRPGTGSKGRYCGAHKPEFFSFVLFYF